MPYTTSEPLQKHSPCVMSSSPSHWFAWVTLTQSSRFRIAVTSSTKALPDPPYPYQGRTEWLHVSHTIWANFSSLRINWSFPHHLMIIHSPFIPSPKQNIWPLAQAQFACKIEFNSHKKPILYFCFIASIHVFGKGYWWWFVGYITDEGNKWGAVLDEP